MPIFGKKKTVQPRKDDRIARAVITPALITMVADGDVSDIELMQLSNLCQFSPIFSPFTSEETAMMFRTLIQSMGQHGVVAHIQSTAANLPPNLRETALCFAMRIALADGVVDPGEKAALSAIGQSLQIPMERFGQILDFVAMMQRPAMAA